LSSLRRRRRSPATIGPTPPTIRRSSNRRRRRRRTPLRNKSAAALAGRRHLKRSGRGANARGRSLACVAVFAVSLRSDGRIRASNRKATRAVWPGGPSEIRARRALISIAAPSTGREIDNSELKTNEVVMPGFTVNQINTPIPRCSYIRLIRGAVEGENVSVRSCGCSA
jgi:hypothetical protein